MISAASSRGQIWRSSNRRLWTTCPSAASVRGDGRKWLRSLCSALPGGSAELLLQDGCCGTVLEIPAGLNSGHFFTCHMSGFKCMRGNLCKPESGCAVALHQIDTVNGNWQIVVFSSALLWHRPGEVVWHEGTCGMKIPERKWARLNAPAGLARLTCTWTGWWHGRVGGDRFANKQTTLRWGWWFHFICIRTRKWQGEKKRFKSWINKSGLKQQRPSADGDFVEEKKGENQPSLRTPGLWTSSHWHLISKRM